MTTTVTLRIFDGSLTQNEATITFPTDRLSFFDEPSAQWIWVPEFQDGIDYNVWIETGIHVLGTNTSLRYRLNVFGSVENVGQDQWILA